MDCCKTQLGTITLSTINMQLHPTTCVTLHLQQPRDEGVEAGAQPGAVRPAARHAERRRGLRGRQGGLFCSVLYY